MISVSFSSSVIVKRAELWLSRLGPGKETLLCLFKSTLSFSLFGCPTVARLSGLMFKSSYSSSVALVLRLNYCLLHREGEKSSVMDDQLGSLLRELDLGLNCSIFTISTGVKIGFLAGITKVLWYCTGLTSLLKLTVKLIELTECILFFGCCWPASRSTCSFGGLDSFVKLFLDFLVSTEISDAALNFFTDC